MRCVRVMWGSQTGASEEIAKQIHERCKQRNITSELTSMLEYEKAQFQNEIIIFVVSSTGDGDPPDNALKFMRHLRTLRRKHGPENAEVALPFQHLKFTLLGLGDTNYPTFQGNPDNLYNTVPFRLLSLLLLLLLLLRSRVCIVHLL
jgi:methionine synthase reductase